MLNAQGRFLYDFFIFEDGQNLMVDCCVSKIDEIIKKLNFYKLRSKVLIEKQDELLVAQNFEALGFVDPRHENLGFRAYLKKSDSENFSKEDEAKYDFCRISNKIAEGEKDLIQEKSFILEFGFDRLNAIDYNKGCYLGQELTARTHHLGQIRKEIIYIILPIDSKLKNGDEISNQGRSGKILSQVIYDNKIHALAIMRIEENQAN